MGVVHLPVALKGAMLFLFWGEGFAVTELGGPAHPHIIWRIL